MIPSKRSPSLSEWSSSNFKEDRTDVIVPAAEIFLTVAEALGSESIIVPNISLADSITDGIWREVQMKD